MQQADPIGRPIGEYGFAVNVIVLHRAKIAAVVREVSMIAQHEVTVFWDGYRTVRALVAEILPHIGLEDRSPFTKTHPDRISTRSPAMPIIRLM